MARSKEPIWWSLFAAGGMVAALFVPVLIFLTGLAVPLGVFSEDRLSHARIAPLAGHPLSRLLLFAVIALPLFHFAHRFRFTVSELGLRGGRTAIAVLCYGAAIAGTVVTAVVLMRFPA